MFSGCLQGQCSLKNTRRAERRLKSVFHTAVEIGADVAAEFFVDFAVEHIVDAAVEADLFLRAQKVGGVEVGQGVGLGAVIRLPFLILLAADVFELHARA